MAVKTITLTLAGLLALSLAGTAKANVEPHALFSDGVVLQEGMPVPVWGWADPGEPVTVSGNGATATAQAGADGRWQVAIGPFQAGGPFELAIAGKNTVVVKDVMVGEVWVCSGQSNMEMVVANSQDAAAEIGAAANPAIRMFTVPKQVAPQPQLKVGGGSWQVANPATTGRFSAVGYFFARELHRRTGKPVGMINSSWGGTPAEAWTSLPKLESLPELAPAMEQRQRQIAMATEPKAKAEYAANLKIWAAAQKDPKATPRQSDPGNKGFGKGWAKPGFADAAWPAVKLPGTPFPGTNGAFWFRKRVEIPAAWAGQELILNLGSMDDYDVAYFNGEKIGATGPETENWWTAPRRYTVPKALAKPGPALIAVRLFDDFGASHFGDPGMTLAPAAGGGQGIALDGDWKAQIEVALNPYAIKGATKPAPPGINSHTPAALYNGMISPLLPFAIRGAIWYQGESNAGQARQYRTLLPALIADWRQGWGQGEFPFGIVQLANYLAAKDVPGNSAWAELREAQLLTARKTPQAGLAVAIDIGDAKDIHPKNKQEVGRRLALWALATVHGQPLEYSGPVYRTMKIEGDKVRLAFDHVGGGLVAKGGPLKRFEIAGADKKFVWAEAVIEGASVVVHAPGIAQPVAVRYAWADNPEGCNLYNQEGLPATPFRTDD
ncbi:MAG: sialate O-acetylesterase [Lentisphaeria bacterium]|jgi:sialate O-acetylesterase